MEAMAGVGGKLVSKEMGATADGVVQMSPLPPQSNTYATRSTFINHFATGKMSICSDSTLSPGKLLETDDYIMCRNLDEKDDLTGNEVKLNSSVVFDDFKSYDSITETTDDWERKIKAFLDDKAQEFKKMQKPLYEEFYNSLNKAAASPSYVDNTGFKATPRLTCSARQRKWKEELDQELQRKREMRRQAGAGGKTSVPKDRALTRQRERTRLASPGSGESHIGYF